MKVYLDNASTTHVDANVLKEMLPYLKNKFGNPSSSHSLGQEAKQALEQAREKVARLINASPEEIIFTGSGTEANNLALKCINASRIITSSIEHSAVLETAKALKESGKQVEIIPVDKEGIININELNKKITPDSLVSIMHVNNEIGTIQPIEEIAKICKQRKAIFHTDAVQSCGKLHIDVKKLGIDMLSGSGHKINAPKGIGFLYIRKDLKNKLNPLIHGGGQESGLRSGTENIAGIVGLGKACELSIEKINNKNKVKELRDCLIKELVKIPGIRLNGSKDKRIFNNVNITINGIEGEALVLMLDKKGISCSTASACTSLSHKHSHILKAIGLSEDDIHSSVRISLGWQNNKKEIDYTIKTIKESIEKLRKISGK